MSPPPRMDYSWSGPFFNFPPVRACVCPKAYCSRVGRFRLTENLAARGGNAGNVTPCGKKRSPSWREATSLGNDANASAGIRQFHFPAGRHRPTLEQRPCGRTGGREIEEWCQKNAPPRTESIQKGGPGRPSRLHPGPPYCVCLRVVLPILQYTRKRVYRAAPSLPTAPAPTTRPANMKRILYDSVKFFFFGVLPKPFFFPIRRATVRGRTRVEAARSF